jgi:hypothetical protein
MKRYIGLRRLRGYMMKKKLADALILWSLVCVASPVPGEAASGQGTMSAGVIDITELNFGQAKKLCDREPYLVQCDRIREKIRAEEIEGASLDPANEEIIYDYEIFTANYQ